MLLALVKVDLRCFAGYLNQFIGSSGCIFAIWSRIHLDLRRICVDDYLVDVDLRRIYIDLR